MNRRFLRSFFNLDPLHHQPFYHARHNPLRTCSYRHREPQVHQEPESAHQIFNRFFTENGVKESEKGFFEQHFPEKFEKKFNPYKILGLKQEATLEEIKEAYRTQALRWHPKNNSTPEAASKFQQLAHAYDSLTSQKYYSKDDSIPSSNSSHPFKERMDHFMKKKHQRKEAEKKTDFREELEGANLYSESTFIKNVNGKKQVFTQKEYSKNGRIFKLRRQQIFKEDGKKEVTQTFDDGRQIKRNIFEEHIEKKKITE